MHLTSTVLTTQKNRPTTKLPHLKEKFSKTLQLLKFQKSNQLFENKTIFLFSSDFSKVLIPKSTYE
jgi:hypothetical protein